MAAGSVAAFLLALGFSKRRKISQDDMFDLLLFILIPAIAGARIGYVISEWSYFAEKPVEMLYIWQGGLTSYGGIIGGLLGGTVFVRLKRLNWFDVADSIGYGLPIGFAVGRIGCFLNGCCYGRVCDTPFSVVFPALGDGYPRIPTQLTETLYSIVIFIILHFYSQKDREPGSVFFLAVGLYGFFRFLNEFLRVNPKIVLGLSSSQIFSLLFIIAALVFFTIKASEKNEGKSD